MIVVLGSINVDYILKVKHLPERGETVLGEDAHLKPGGKGANQAAAAARFGAATAMVGCVGRDPYGDAALHKLKEFGVDLAQVWRVDAMTGMAFVMVEDDGENLIAVASGANREVRAHQLRETNLGTESTLLLQLEIPVREVELAIHLARSAGSRVILNAAPAAALGDAALRACDVLVTNEGEANQLAGMEREPVAQAIALANRFGTDCIVTLGGDGAVLACGGGLYRIAALPIQPIDTVGAGDAFVGTLAASLDRGAKIVEALQFATAAGGLACLSQGAQEAVASRECVEAAAARLAPPVAVAQGQRSA